MPLKHWVEMVSRIVHESFEGDSEYDINYIYKEWNYTRDAKLKCREDLAIRMTECKGGQEEDIDVDILWTVFRHRLEKKKTTSTTRALQLALQEAWETPQAQWLNILQI